ncbi:MAG TPA: hypothetical protein DDW76_22815 [Cyanobacteria bacterium UBA11369]|nr:hypothetical protein [Cyanobacteria bacterium UBA11371]HBE51531.1 hypothetical protein [Cyanobacteria bacterium UBA11369]
MSQFYATAWALAIARLCAIPKPITFVSVKNRRCVNQRSTQKPGFYERRKPLRAALILNPPET